MAVEDSLMSNDTLLFRSSTTPDEGIWGMKGYAMPDMPHRSDVIACSLLVCLLLLFFIHISHQRSLKEIFSDFFLPSNNGRQKVEESGVEWKRIIFALLFSVQGALLMMVVTQLTNAMPPMISPWLFLGICTLLFLVYITVKQFLYHFVHSVFFSRSQQRRWRDNYVFLFCAMTLLFFPLLLLLIYFQIDLKIVLISGLTLLLIVKILLLLKCFSTFFEKFYGILHLFVYFCTLEAAPVVVLWTILKEFTKGLYLL